MIKEKGLDPIVADRIGGYVKLKGEGIINLNSVFGFAIMEYIN